MDVIDIAQDQAETLRKIAINNARRKINTANPIGTCWHCGEKTGKERRWCNADCCSDWERDR